MEEINKVKIGRPSTNFNKKEYMKIYYQNNKDKYKSATYHCEICNLISSKANKSRHIKTYHKDQKEIDVGNCYENQKEIDVSNCYENQKEIDVSNWIDKQLKVMKLE